MEKQDCSKELKIEGVEGLGNGNGFLLEVLFNNQANFMELLSDSRGLHYQYLNSNQKDALSREYLEAIVQECCELREELRWKSWKQYPKDFKHDVENIKFEIADIMCFLMDLALVWGMDAKMFFDYVNSKQKLNFKRQEDPDLGYVQK